MKKNSLYVTAVFGVIDGPMSPFVFIDEADVEAARIAAKWVRNNPHTDYGALADTFGYYYDNEGNLNPVCSDVFQFCAGNVRPANRKEIQLWNSKQSKHFNGFPYKEVKKAVRTINKYGFCLMDIFDDDAYDSINWEDVPDDVVKDVMWAYHALQWAGFNSKKPTAAYAAPLFAYEFEEKIKR